jgi:aminoglycoside phosphotransferase (APT) family kinase protein
MNSDTQLDIPDTAQDLARSAVRQVFGVEPDSVQPVVTQGTVNWTFRAVLGEKAYAVRLNRSRTAEEAHVEFSKERWAMDVARSLRIPTPGVVATYRSSEAAAVVLEWIEGRPASHDRNAYRCLGTYARRLAHASVEADPALFPDPFGGWSGQLQYNLAQLTDEDPLLRLGTYREDQRPALRRAIELLLERPFSVGFRHGDLTPQNLLFGERGQAVLLDWGCARFDVVPIEEISDLRRERMGTGKPSLDCFRVFVHELGMDWAGCQALLPVLNAWLLLKSVDLVRWALDRCP